MFLMAATVLIGSAWAEETNTRSLEDRVLALEQKQGSEDDGPDIVTVRGVLAYAYQSEHSTGPSDPDDPSGWAMPFQPEVSITPTDQDEVFVKFGFAAGDGLNAVTNFTLAPWGADLSEDIRNLSGGTRDYLLTAWYKHSLVFSEGHSLGLSGGIVDATDYIDQNAYSNDEYTQFMHEALVNSPNAFLPSYEPGAAFEWNLQWLDVNGVYMYVAENEDGRPFSYYGAQVMATIDPGIGKGQYRFTYSRTSDDFLDPVGSAAQARAIFLISCDQKLSEWLGAWVRFGNQTTDAVVNYDSIISGGFQLGGVLWGRERDTVGVGCAWLNGAEQTTESLSRTSVFEAYAQFGLNDYVAVTLDLQHMDDRYVATAADGDVSGWIVGTRLAVGF
jgi:porin